MQKIRAIVIDDEVKSREVIKALIANFCEDVEVVSEAGDIEQSLKIIHQFKPDLVFLDITLKEGDSFQILQKLESIDFDIIFVTAYDEYSVRALKFSGITCLFKPLDIEELQSAIRLVRNRATNTGLAYEMVNGILKSKFTRIPIITSGGLRFTDVSEITFIEKNPEGVMVHTLEGENIQSKRDLQEFAEIIMHNKFLSIGQRMLVNKDLIDPVSLIKGQLSFKNGIDLPVSKQELERLKEQSA
ncbi:MAG: response regulator [Bacteroidetes bacterium]|nr:response regulator [Bacteroidota bacterium]